jgi:alkylated DNA nucleotide flippase Atl1
MPEMNTYERALQIYQVLVSAAHNRQTLTYGLLGKAVGLPARSLGHHLLHIANYCQQNGLPPLTVIVVQTGGGHPGSGLAQLQGADRERESVYRHDWFKMRPLTVEMLRASR